MKTKYTPSEIRNAFFNNLNPEETEFECNMCAQKLRIPFKIYSNLKKHMLRKHPEVFETDGETPDDSDKSIVQDISKFTPIKTQTATKEVFLDLFSNTNLSLNLLDNPEFFLFIAKLNPEVKPPTKYALKLIMNEKASNYVEELSLIHI